MEVTPVRIQSSMTPHMRINCIKIVVSCGKHGHMREWAYFGMYIRFGKAEIPFIVMDNLCDCHLSYLMNTITHTVVLRTHVVFPCQIQ